MTTNRRYLWQFDRLANVAEIFDLPTLLDTAIALTDALAAAHGAGHLGHGALAVRTGDREQTRPRCTARHHQAVEGACKDLDVADDFDAAMQCLLHQRFPQRHAGTDGDQADAVEARRAERPGIDADTGHRCARGIERRRGGARIGDAHLRAGCREPARHRQSGRAQPEHQR